MKKFSKSFIRRQMQLRYSLVKFYVKCCLTFALLLLFAGVTTLTIFMFDTYRTEEEESLLSSSSCWESESSNYVDPSNRGRNSYLSEPIYKYAVNDKFTHNKFKQFILPSKAVNNVKPIKVVILMLSTSITELLCYSLASSLLTDIPMVIVGMKMLPYTHLKKPFVYLQAIKELQLNDEDVIINMDSDVIFTGESIDHFVEEFIAFSPSSLDELNVVDVRSGKSKAPSIFFGEKQCVGNQWFKDDNECEQWYDEVEIPHAEYFGTKKHLMTMNTSNSDSGDQDKVKEQNGKVHANNNNDESKKQHVNANLFRYINAGIGIHRVWSYKRLMASLSMFVDKNDPKEGIYWDDDQAQMHLLYGSLLEDEVTYNVKSGEFDNKKLLRYDMYAGMLAVDQSASVVSVVTEIANSFYELEYANWLEYSAEKLDELEFKHDVYAYNIRDIIAELFYNYQIKKQLFAEVIITNAMPEHSQHTYRVKHSLPLLALKKQITDDDDNNAHQSVFPRILHFAGPGLKQTRVTRAINYLPWFVPLRFDANGRQHGLNFLSQAHIHFLLNKTYEIHNYRDVCSGVIKHLYYAADFEEPVL